MLDGGERKPPPKALAFAGVIRAARAVPVEVLSRACTHKTAIFRQSPVDVCFAPKSGQTADVLICPLCAKSGLTQRSKMGLLDHLVGGRKVELRCPRSVVFSSAGSNRAAPALRPGRMTCSRTVRTFLEASMAHVFISYSRRDGDAIRRLQNMLVEAGHQVWTD